MPPDWIKLRPRQDRWRRLYAVPVMVCLMGVVKVFEGGSGCIRRLEGGLGLGRRMGMGSSIYMGVRRSVFSWSRLRGQGV